MYYIYNSDQGRMHQAEGVLRHQLGHQEGHCHHCQELPVVEHEGAPAGLASLFNVLYPLTIL